MSTQLEYKRVTVSPVRSYLRIYAYQSGNVAMFMPAMSSRGLQRNFSAFTVTEIHFFSSLYTNSTSYVQGTRFENMIHICAQTHTYARMLTRTLARTHVRCACIICVCMHVLSKHPCSVTAFYIQESTRRQCQTSTRTRASRQLCTAPSKTAT